MPVGEGNPATPPKRADVTPLGKRVRSPEQAGADWPPSDKPEGAPAKNATELHATTATAEIKKVRMVHR